MALRPSEAIECPACETLTKLSQLLFVVITYDADKLGIVQTDEVNHGYIGKCPTCGAEVFERDVTG
jgi:hypothetical protein